MVCFWLAFGGSLPLVAVVWRPQGQAVAMIVACWQSKWTKDASLAGQEYEYVHQILAWTLSHDDLLIRWLFLLLFFHHYTTAIQ